MGSAFRCAILSVVQSQVAYVERGWQHPMLQALSSSTSREGLVGATTRGLEEDDVPIEFPAR